MVKDFSEILFQKESRYKNEWQRTNPDLVIYRPGGPIGDDAVNQQFLVAPTPKGDWLATWTSASEEGTSDQRVVVARSGDRGRTWTKPLVVAGPELDGDGKIASWGFPIMVPKTGRIYMVYNKSIDPGIERADWNGAMFVKWSDDDGRTWSKEAVNIPIADAEIDGSNPRPTKNWFVRNLPIWTSWGEVLVGYTRWSSRTWDSTYTMDSKAYAPDPLMVAESAFFRFDNIPTENDPARLRTTTLPKGGQGLRCYYGSRPAEFEDFYLEEPAIVELSDQRLLATMRSSHTGMIYHSISSDHGLSWTSPRPLLSRPGGKVLFNPSCSCPIYKMKDGRYLLVYYNHPRNNSAVCVTVGREGTGHPDCPLIFGPPKILAATDDVPLPGLRQRGVVADSPSFIDNGKERILFYPDRKHFLLGRYLTDEWLADCDPVPESRGSVMARHAKEWKRTNPDLVIYKPGSPVGRDALNQHFLVAPTPGGDWLASWCCASDEGAPDQRVVVAQSSDRGKTWTKPLIVAGGELDGDGKIASWGFPIMAPKLGRIYMFYAKSIDNGIERVDLNGAMYVKWSDDDGRTWSKEGFNIPIADAEIDGPSPRPTKNWIVWQLPMITSWGEVMVGYTRWACKMWDTRYKGLSKVFTPSPMMSGESSFFRFDNVLTERDPSKLRTTTLPRGGKGLRCYGGGKPARIEYFNLEEPSIVELSDHRLFCVMRNGHTGMIYHSISSDRGETWKSPRPLLYRPGGSPVHCCYCSCPIYKMHDGRYLLVFYNNDGTANGSWPVVDWRRNRTPAYLSVAHEGTDDPDCPLIFGPPKMFATSDCISTGTPGNRCDVASYPSFVDDGKDRILFYPDRKHFLLGRYLTDEWLEDCDPYA